MGAGGTPPNINDFNGVLNYVTAWLRWNQAGGPVPYDASFSAEIGGYPNGAIILAALTMGMASVGGGLWVTKTVLEVAFHLEEKIRETKQPSGSSRGPTDT